MSSIINANNHPGSQPSMANNGSGSANASAVSTSIDINAVKGATKLSELIKTKKICRPNSYTVAGECESPMVLWIETGFISTMEQRNDGKPWI